jgi:hypothetical protein
MTGMTTILLLANLLATAGVFLWMRRARRADRVVEAQHRREVIARLGGLTVATEAQTSAFSRDGAALLAAVRAAVPVQPIPAAPVSGERVSAVEDDGDERRTVEMAVWPPEGERLSAEELTRVVDTSGGVIKADTRRKLVALAHGMKGGAK